MTRVFLYSYASAREPELFAGRVGSIFDRFLRVGSGQKDSGSGRVGFGVLDPT